MSCCPPTQTSPSGALSRAINTRHSLIIGKRWKDVYKRQMLEEAKKRDHRKIGKDLELFTILEEGPGLSLIHI